jgi:cytochrome c55X
MIPDTATDEANNRSGAPAFAAARGVRIRQQMTPSAWLLNFALAVAVVLVPLASVAQTTSGAAQAVAGERIYADYCAHCHGEELRNTSAGVTFDLRRLRPDERSRFENAVLNGKNQMPPWRGVLDMGQIDAIWQYIRATVDR